MGALIDVAALPREGDRPAMLVALRKRGGENGLVFAPDRASGEPPGVYLLALGPDGLEEVDRLPPIEGEEEPGNVLVADLEGDGVREVVVRYKKDNTRGSRLYRRRAGGGYDDLVLGGLVPIGVDDVDGDGRDELLVADDDQGGKLAWLGWPGPALPTRTPTFTKPAVAPGRVAAIEDMVALGLFEPAAEQYLLHAELNAGEPRARFRAAELLESAGALSRAGELYVALSSDASVGQTADQGAARVFAATSEVGSEHAALQRLLARDALPADQRERATARLNALNAEGLTTLDFTEPLNAAWRIDAPDRLRRDKVEGGLLVDAFLHDGRIAALPLRVNGDRLVIEFEIDIERIEYGSGLYFALRTGRPDADEGTTELGVLTIFGWGGADLVKQLVYLGAGGYRLVDHDRRLLSTHGYPIRLTAVFDRRVGEMSMVSEGRVQRVPLPDLAKMAEEVTLSITASPRTRSEQGEIRARLRRLSVAGASVDGAVAGPPSGTALARQRLVESDARGALAALDGVDEAADAS
ncbi:MAG: hypothetical protein KC620_25320, partial [Myxococcales bacterium]|nr:hypothetical protein [Myxococcales bacterium]